MQTQTVKEGGAEAKRVVVLNAMPLNALPPQHLRLEVLPITPKEFVNWVQRRLREGYKLVHYIRHASTVQALRQAGVPLSENPEAGLYRYQEGDLLAVVTLKNPTRGQEQASVTLDDLAVWVVWVA